MGDGASKVLLGKFLNHFAHVSELQAPVSRALTGTRGMYQTCATGSEGVHLRVRVESHGPTNFSALTSAVMGSSSCLPKLFTVS